MRLKDHIRLRYFLAGVSLITPLFTGCIREDRSACATETDLYIKVQPAEFYGGSSAPVEEATVYLFDHNKRFISQIGVSRQQIESNIPVRISVSPSDNPWAVVWGNIKENEQVSGLGPSAQMDEVLVMLKKDSEGYDIAPDNLFYGIKKLSGSGTEEVTISLKVGRVELTVKGLPQDARAEDYYFTVDAAYGGYDFEGSPLAHATEMKIQGVFNANHDLTTQQPFNMVHYPTGDTNRGGETAGAVINLWKVNGGNPELLASAIEDSSGRPIKPEAGKKTNVLIYFRDDGSMEVSVVITGWDEIYQWNEW